MIDELHSQVKIESRPYQRRIVEKAIGLFSGTIDPSPRGPYGSVMIESPTGSGKTVMGLLVAKWLQDHFGFRVGWVAMRRNLLQQAAAENQRWGFGVELRLISMFDRQPAAVDAVIVDEAQHDAAASMANLHGVLHPKKILGLSATPFRTDRMKLCFDKVIKDAGIQTLIQDGYLSPYRHYTIPTHAPAGVAECLAREPERWGKSLIFFHRRTECMECQRLLRRRGIRSEVVTATSNRDRQLEAFEAGKVDVLISMAILTEGFDCPTLATVFCRPSGRSCTVQMAGRVLRKHASLPIKQIVQCRSTRHPFARTALPAEQFTWTDAGWRTLRMNAQLHAISQRALQAIAAAPVELPQRLRTSGVVALPSWALRTPIDPASAETV